MMLQQPGRSGGGGGCGGGEVECFGLCHLGEKTKARLAGSLCMLIAKLT